MSVAPPTQLSSFLSRGYAQAHDRAIWDSLLHMIGGGVGVARARSSNPPRWSRPVWGGPRRTCFAARPFRPSWWGVLFSASRPTPGSAPPLSNETTTSPSPHHCPISPVTATGHWLSGPAWSPRLGSLYRRCCVVPSNSSGLPAHPRNPKPNVRTRQSRSLPPRWSAAPSSRLSPPQLQPRGADLPLADSCFPATSPSREGDKNRSQCKTKR